MSATSCAGPIGHHLRALRDAHARAQQALARLTLSTEAGGGRPANSTPRPVASCSPLGAAGSAAENGGSA